jgi:hypothetical protein
MLMFTGVVTEITEQGPRQMLILASPRIPGSHYKVETDPGTAARMRALINTEVHSACLAEKISGFSDEEDPQHDQSLDRS